MSTTELDLYRKKLCRQLSQYFDRIGIQADKTLLIYHQDIVCYVTIQQWGDEQTNNSDYFNTYANLSGSLIVWRCIDKPIWGNYPINL
jgi:hypothetical protein